MRQTGVGLVVVCAAALVGCNSGGSSGSGGGTTAPPPPSGPAQRFEVVIENLSHETVLPTSLGAFAWTTHQASSVPVGTGSAASAGLEVLAEDASAADFVNELAAAPGFSQQGQLGALAPGARVTFQISARPGADARFSLLGMVAESNDAFLAGSVDLFDGSSAPITTSVPVSMQLFDAGTETNEVPGAGNFQQPRQRQAGWGVREGVIHPLYNPMNAFPPAGQLVEVAVRAEGAELVFTLTNTARSAGLVSALGPVFFASHTSAWQAFTPGQPAPPSGLESLVEDADPAPLVAFAATVAEVGSSGAADVTLERPTAPPGPAQPGERFEVRVTPDPAFPRLTLLAMILESNDAFVGFEPEGLALFDDNGALRPTAELAAEAQVALRLWDAGTELNQIPGVGTFQPARQPSPNSGLFDTNSTLRRYDDRSQPFRAYFGGSIRLDVTHSDNANPTDLVLTFTNTGQGMRFGPELLLIYHPLPRAFVPEGVASPGLRLMAQEGDSSLRVSEVSAVPDVIVDVRPLDLGPGQVEQVVITPSSAVSTQLSLALRVSPSNDAMLMSGVGVEVYRPSFGRVVDATVVEEELRRDVSGYDLGVEVNEVGAAGPSQPPGATTGGSEGNGLVRPFADPVWSYPAPARLIRVTVRPVP